MLVLSRRASQQILFPSLGVTVHVLGFRGQCARIGIEAPPEVPVLRQELDQAGAAPAGRRVRPSWAHTFRNHLNKVNLCLQLAQAHWEQGREKEGQVTLQQGLDLLEKLEREFTATAGRSAEPTQATKGPIRTLIVDDDANERALLAGLLSMKGCRCDTAVDGVDALAYLEKNEHPDLVLLDLWMPRCDGVQTLAKIRRNRRLAGLKVFVISGTPPHEAGIAPGPGSADAWFTKPLNPRQLWQAIQESLASPAAAN
jgi:carbon storage regulator CsrA